MKILPKEKRLSSVSSIPRLERSGSLNLGRNITIDDDENIKKSAPTSPLVGRKPFLNPKRKDLGKVGRLQRSGSFSLGRNVNVNLTPTKTFKTSTPLPLDDISRPLPDFLKTTKAAKPGFKSFVKTFTSKYSTVSYAF